MATVTTIRTREAAPAIGRLPNLDSPMIFSARLPIGTTARRETADERAAAKAEGPVNDRTGPEREGRDGDERNQAQDLLGPAIAAAPER
jgi:hypothetical protein